MKSNPELSIVLPVYEEEEALPSLLDELIKELDSIGKSYEIIFINKPGKDKSFDVLKGYSDKYENVYAVSASNNRAAGFQKGHQLKLGFELASGDVVIMMDSDYQDDPSDLPKFLEALNSGYQVVVGWKQNRKDPFFYKLTSKIQNTISRNITGVQIHDKNCGFKGFTREAVNSLSLHGMNFRDIVFQLAAKGFKITEVPINNRVREGGEQKFNFVNRLKGGTVDFLADVLMAQMNDKPFQFWGIISGFSILASFVMTVVFVLWIALTGNTLSFNWWSVLYLLLNMLVFLIGLMSFVIGVISEFLVHSRDFNIADYSIVEDPKDLVDSRIG